MGVQNHDLKGLKCPQPTLRLTAISLKSPKGDVIEVEADCPSFEEDVKNWCARSKKVLLWIRDEGGGIRRCQIQV